MTVVTDRRSRGELEVRFAPPMFLKRAVGLHELFLAPLYEGETLLQPMVEYLRAIDFDPWALIPGFVDKRNGRLLQVERVYSQRRGEEQSLSAGFIQ